MSYENLTKEELILLLQKKDDEVSDYKDRLEDSNIHISHFIYNKHYDNEVFNDVIEEDSESDIDFDSLIVESEENNSNEVKEAKESFGKIIQKLSGISESIFSFREDKLMEAVEDLRYCIENKIPYDIKDFNLKSYMGFDYTYSNLINLKNRSHLLKEFVGVIENEDLVNSLYKQEHIFTMFDLEKEEHIKALNKLVTNLLSSEPMILSFYNLNKKEKLDKIIEHVPYTKIILSLKEKEELIQNLNNEDTKENNHKKRL